MIRSYIIILLWSLFFLLLQTSLMPIIMGDYLLPNLTTILVVFIACHFLKHSGLFLVFLLGILVDLAAAQLLGVWSSAYVLVFTAFVVFAQNLFLESQFVVFFAVVLSALLTEVVRLLAFNTLGELNLSLLLQVILNAGFLGLLAIFVFPILKKTLLLTDKRNLR